MIRRSAPQAQQPVHIMSISKLSRRQVEEALSSVPVSHILGSQATRELTPKQRAFAMEIAKGSRGAEAYRRVYSDKGKKKTQGDDASRLRRHPGVSAEIDAYRLALEAQEHRSPAALRALVVQSLVQVLIDPEASHSARTNAARVLGTVTEVAAFTERREVRTINDSIAAREALLNEIKDLMRTVEMPAAADADSLLAELASDSKAAAPHPVATPPDAIATHRSELHSPPHTRSENSDESPSPVNGEDPPADGTEVKNGV